MRSRKGDSWMSVCSIRLLNAFKVFLSSSSSFSILWPKVFPLCFVPSWLIGFVINLVSCSLHNVFGGKAIRGIESIQFLWLVNFFPYVVLASFLLRPTLSISPSTMRSCSRFSCISFNWNSFFLLHLHFPALIASSSCVWGKFIVDLICIVGCWHYADTLWKELRSVIRNWRDLTPHFAYMHVRSFGLGQRSSEKCLFITFFNAKSY